MDFRQLTRMRDDTGIMASLDGIESDLAERILLCPAFTQDKVTAAVLSEEMLDRSVGGLSAADYLWKVKGIVPFLRGDRGLAEERNGVRLLRPNPGLAELAARAASHNVFGLEMRSLIVWPETEGVRNMIRQQLTLAGMMRRQGLVPVIRLEVDPDAREYRACEEVLLEEIPLFLEKMSNTDSLILRLSAALTEEYLDRLTDYPCVVRAEQVRPGPSFADILGAEQSDAGFAVALTDILGELYDATR